MEERNELKQKADEEKEKEDNRNRQQLKIHEAKNHSLKTPTATNCSEF